MGPAADLNRCYDLLNRLAGAVDGPRRLGDCTGYPDWPGRGGHFLFALDEWRGSGDHRRPTRVGTHAVSAGSETTLWDRLRTHRGNQSGTLADGGNHRGSVFRERVGEALIAREGLDDAYPQWGERSTADREVRLKETGLERRVSAYVRKCPVLWLPLDDDPGPDSDRAYVERNAVALASNYRRDPIDLRSGDWLGSHSPAPEIRRSGLWNVDHVDGTCDPDFLAFFGRRIAEA